jgi:hypothetical protein
MRAAPLKTTDLPGETSMPTSDFPVDELNPIAPLIATSAPIEAAADTMLAASRTMLAAASSISSALGPTTARTTELLTEAVEAGFLRALRRDTLLGGFDDTTAASATLRLPTGKGFPGTGYGRMGASVTGSGARAQLYGSIGGAIGYAVGGPVGAVLGGMLGGLFGGGDDDDGEEARRQEELRRQWLNTPDGFEIQAYLYNLTMRRRSTGSLIPISRTAAELGFPWYGLAFPGRRGGQSSTPAVFVSMPPGAVQITGQGEEAGQRAARAFAGALGQALRLNSVVVPAAGMGGEL